MKKLIFSSIALLSLCIGALLVSAADQPAGERPARSRTGTIPMRGKVAAVDVTARTVSIEGKEAPRVFSLTADTRIIKDKKPATLGDVVVGNYVTGSYLQKEGKMELKTLYVVAEPGRKSQ